MQEKKLNGPHSHLYELSDGRFKRFFDEADIKRFFADWKELFVREAEVMYGKSNVDIQGKTVERSESKKALWIGAMQVQK